MPSSSTRCLLLLLLIIHHFTYWKRCGYKSCFLSEQHLFTCKYFNSSHDLCFTYLLTVYLSIYAHGHSLLSLPLQCHILQSSLSNLIQMTLKAHFFSILIWFLILCEIRVQCNRSYHYHFSMSLPICWYNQIRFRHCLFRQSCNWQHLLAFVL